MKNVAINIYENKIADFLSKQSKKNSKKIFEKTEGYKSDIYLNKLSKFLISKKPKKIIDLGCGIGRLFKFYSKYPNHKYTGVEINKELLSIAKKVKKIYKLKISLKAENVFTFKNVNKYNLVFCCGLIDCFSSNFQKILIKKLCNKSKDKIILEKIRLYSFFHIIFLISKISFIKKIFKIFNIFIKFFIKLFNLKINIFFSKLISLLDDLSSIKINNFSYSPFHVKEKNYYVREFAKNNFQLIEAFNYNSLEVLVFKKNA